jgi:hypothetical protein
MRFPPEEHDWLDNNFFFGGGGGGGSTQFHAQGSPPSFQYLSPSALNQMAVGADAQSYAMSDQAFANQYPALQQAYNQYQSNLGKQVGLVGQGQAGQSQLMGGLANTIAGRMQTPTTQNIQNMQNAAATMGSAVNPIYGMGAQQASYAQPITNLGMSQAGLAQPLVGMGMNVAGQMGGIGNQINQQAGNLYGAAQIPYQLGQQLLQEPIDPQTQQQMMHAGLGQAAGALGAASLGQGMAGQSAAARQLGLNTLQYGQAMRGEAMGDIGQYSSMLGAAGQMQGLGAGIIGQGGQIGGQLMGLGGQQLAQGAQTMGLGSQQLGQAAQTYGLGANVAGAAGGMYGQAQQAQETYGMDTAQMASIYGGMQNQQATNLLGNIANAGQMFAKRPYGLGGTNMAQVDLSQAGAYNSFQQANYATMNGIAFNQAQLNAQQQQLQAQQNASMTGALLSTGTTAATTAAMVSAMACWVARAVYGTRDNRWKTFRHWLLHKAPSSVRSAYLRHGQSVASMVRRSSLLRFCLRLAMDSIIKRTVYVQCGA